MGPAIDAVRVAVNFTFLAVFYRLSSRDETPFAVRRHVVLLSTDNNLIVRLYRGRARREFWLSPSRSAAVLNLLEISKERSVVSFSTHSLTFYI